MTNHDSERSEPSTLFEPEIEIQVRHALIALRHFQIIQGEVPRAQLWSPTTLSKLHTACLGPVFPWAGERRTHELTSPGGKPYAPLEDDHIETLVDQAIEIGRSADWQLLSHEELATRCAQIYALIHYAQPFEKNTGQIIRLLLSMAARYSPFHLRFARIPVVDWDNALEATLPTPPSTTPDHTPLIPVFEQVAIPANSAQPHGYREQQPITYTALDVVAPWRELYDGTSLGFKIQVNEVFANNWLDGWPPNRADVANLIDHHKGRIDTRDYLEDATIKIT